MIDAKQAVQIAKASAADLLNQASSNLEEIERDSYKAREVWSITLSLRRNVTEQSPVVQLFAAQLQYTRFLIDIETGELVAVKLRELASQ